MLRREVPVLTSKFDSPLIRDTSTDGLVFDGLQVYYLEAGGAIFRCGDEEIKALPGQAVFFNEQVIHSIVDADADTVILTVLIKSGIVFSGKKKEKSDGLSRFIPNHLVFRPEKYTDKAIINQILDIYRVGEAKEPGYEIEILGKLYTLFGQGVEYLRKHKYESKWESRQSEAMHRMLAYIHENFNQTVSVASVAAAGYVSRSQCYMIFKRFVNKTPIEYVNYYKISKSMEYMLDASLNLTEIASLCGFGSPSYYSETFAKVMNCTPSKYRKSLQPSSEV